MANEIELANISHQTDVVSAQMTGPFVNADQVFPFVLTETFPDNTNVILFPKSGKVEAQAQAESTAYSYGADDEITDTETSVTGAKKAQAMKISSETEEFGGNFASRPRYAAAQAQALARLAAADLKTLFSSIAGSVTATTTLTKDNIMDAQYTVRSATLAGAASPILVGWFDYKGVNELGKELTDTTATAFSNQVDLGILGTSSAGMPRGTLFDVSIYETTGLPTSGGDDVACIWDPSLAFCAGISGNPFHVTITPPQAATPWYELYVWTFWKIAEHNDTAAVRVLSDT